ncbi:AraC family transcriptional regulator [Cohnella ginsengisoli]|uniref:AraC family transcriptional regulator n=1 Tax=Cohnella ginsengisoli TaxID=425004 RepID=A0A9X4KLP8_9BACL|nr:AraC family transcriptional regulator [Cohnella ginsengisoli]MDG0794201.1 AraC family transcriptional regulator [Cohnella ginsengisoli]
MSIRTVVLTTRAAGYLSQEQPIFINRVQESFEMSEHNHEFMEINFVSEGTGFQYIEGQTLPVTKGDLFFLPTGASHVFRPSHARPESGQLIVYNCLFDGAFSRSLRGFFAEDPEMLAFMSAPYPEQPWMQAKDKDGAFQRIFNTLFEESRAGRPDSLSLMQAELIKLLLLLRRIAKIGDLPEAARAGEDTLASMLDALRRDPARPVRMREMAARAGFSERQFRRRFAARTGMNYSDYVNKLRIERCCELLLATNEKIEAVARRAGYVDMKSFHRMFKRVTGLAPRQYRHAYGSTMYQ